MEPVALDLFEIQSIPLILLLTDGIKTQVELFANQTPEEYRIWHDIIQMGWDHCQLEVHSKFNGWLEIMLSTTKNPRVVKVYMSPAITSGQTADFTADQMMQNKICEGPFINCGKGAGVDTTGDSVPCTLSCTVPANTPQGTYTLWWQWDWTVNDGAIYATCADVTVSSSIVAPPNNPATSARTSNAASAAKTSAARTSAGRTTAARTSAAIQNNPGTSAEAEQDTVDQPVESKIAAGDCGDPAMCVTACGGQELVGQCTCNNGQFLIHCTSSSFAVVPLLAVILGVVMILL